MSAPVAQIASTGMYMPERIMTNDELSTMVDTNDQWIRERTGMVERRVSSDKETLAWMSARAGEQALERAGLKASDLDVIVLGTASPDRLLPSTACDIQAEMGAENAAAFDIAAACSGFLYGLSIARGMIAAGQGKNILVVGGERLSRIVNYKDRATCILFGDGAGAAVVTPSENGAGIISSYMKSDGRLAELLYRPAGGGLRTDEKMIEDGSFFIHMSGREVFKHAVRSMADACDHALADAGLTGEDVDVMVPHQANVRIIDATAKHAGIDSEKVFVNVDKYGNTSAASIPIALDECVRAGKIKKGSTVLLAAFGGGFTWASMVVKW